MSYDSSKDWQMMPPAWRDEQIHKCLCTLKTNLASYFEGASQPLVYRALLSQSGTDAPTAIVLENTLGEVPTFVYNSTGFYILVVSNNLFVGGKVYLDFRSKVSEAGDFTTTQAYWFDFKRASDTSIYIYSTRGDGTSATDDALLNTELMIYIYP